MSQVWDFCVIGAGSGGVRAARRAAAAGAKTLLIEDREWGGTCVNRGCIPKKLYVYAGAHRGLVAEASSFGWRRGGENAFVLAELRRRKEAEIARLRGLYEKNCRAAGVEMLLGAAMLKEKHDGFFSVAVRRNIEGKGEEEEEVRAKTLLLATGGEPISLGGMVEGGEIACVSDAVFELAALPKRVVVLGGGYIALECAGIFNALGAHTTLLHRNEMLLRSFDRDVVRRCSESMAKRGIVMRLSRHLRRLSKEGDEIRIDLEASKDHKEESLRCDFVLAALGRTARTRGLGLEALGVETDGRGKIITDESFATSVKGIYALGDVTDSPELTPVAIRQAEILVARLFHNSEKVFDARALPRAVFATPALASVGLSEEEARATGAVRVYESSFTPLRSSLLEGAAKEPVFVKLIERGDGEVGTGEVLGCHMVGSDAPEIIQSLGLGLRLRAKKKDFDEVLALHPTNAEEFMTLREFRV